MKGRASALLLVAVLAFLLVLAACGDDGGDPEAFCATARRFAVDNPANVFDTYDPNDPEAAAALLRDAAERLRGWADDAPGDVADDTETIAQAADDLAELFESPPPPEEREDLEARFRDVEEASGRVTAYARTECGVELDVPAPASTG